MHNVPYALQHIRHILPDSISGPNSDTCPPTSSIRIPHLPDHTDLLQEEAGAGAGQTGPRPGHAESWQGLPPQTMSTGGSSAPSSFVISPSCSISGNRRRVTEMGNGSISLAHRGRMPRRAAASGNPPMPSKRLPKVSILITSYLTTALAMVLVVLTAAWAV